jgi:DNA-binding LacI/PurR family transcriptional regulator
MVSRDTEQKIRALAEEMGYRPNPLLSSLASKRFRTASAVAGTPVAVLSFPTTPHGHAKMKSYEIYLEDFARKYGYLPGVWNVCSSSDPARLHRTLYHRMVQGLIIVGSVNASEFGKNFDWNNFAIVQCGRYHSAQPFHIVRPNIFQAVKLVFSKLRERGYQRIGFALGRHEEAMEDDEARYGAAASIEMSYVNKKNRIPVYNGRFDDRQDFLGWAQKHKPDAIIGFTPAQYWMLRDAGWRIPEDVGFACMHVDKERDKFCSGLMQNPAEICRQSILLLDQLLRGRERGLPERPLDILVPSEWNSGQTLR